MRVKGHSTTFRLPKTFFHRLRLGFLAAYIFGIGIYLYYGLQPYRVDASAPIRLVVPSINLSTPVDNVTKTGHSLDVPEFIAGAYSENTNKTLLIGHSNTVFERLSDLKIGQRLTFDDQSYQITRIITAAKANISMPDILSPVSTPTVILMTCTGTHLGGHDYSHRLIITAEAVTTLSAI